MLVASFVITVGEIDESVGLVSPTVTLPPRETAEPLIVIAEFESFALSIDPANSELVTDPVGKLTAVLVLRAIVLPDSPTVIVLP